VPGKTLALLFALLLPAGPAQAWTGISASVGEYDSHWLVDGELRPVTLTRYDLAVEDRTRIGLRVGLAIGEFGVRVHNADSSLVQDYAGEYLNLRLRWPLRLSRELSLHGQLNYGWQSGEEDGSSNAAELNWSSLGLRLGLQLQLGSLGLRPFIEWHSVDGDVDIDGSRRPFETGDRYHSGLIIDLRVDPSGHVRLTWSQQGRQGLLLSFVRAY
jgi:hypothetical protein